MRLVVDASTLVAEVLRTRGREMLSHQDLELVIAEDAWGETRHELGKRVTTIAQRGFLPSDAAFQLLEEALAVLTARITVVSAEAYAEHLPHAESRSDQTAMTLPPSLWPSSSTVASGPMIRTSSAAACPFGSRRRSERNLESDQVPEELVGHPADLVGVALVRIWRWYPCHS